MALYQVSSGDRILAADLNQFYSILKGVAASGEAITLIYNAAGSLIIQPSSDPAAATEAVQVKNNAGTVQSALSYDGRFYAADGLVGTPGITFESDKDTGLYRTGANAAAWANGGVIVSPMAVMVASGGSHAPGFVPDPGASGGTSKFLREDATWVAPTAGITIATEQATTSGTSIDFTGIPSGTKRITIMLKGVSTNGTSVPLVQIGKSGGIENTGYLGSGTSFDAAVTTSNFTTGFGLAAANAAACVWHGTFTLTLERASTWTWTMSGSWGRSDAAQVGISTGSKSLAAELDRIRLTTVNGTDAFDAGVMSISYE